MIVLVVLGVLAVLAVLALAHWYLWRRLVRDVSAPGGRWRRAGTVLAVVLPLLSLGALVGGRGLPMSVERWLAWPGYLWLAVLLYLLMAVAVGEALRPLLLRLPRPRAATPPEPVAAPASATAPAAADG
ncbi:metallophosphoesterase, partial [Kitasatospora sp. NPDC059973]